MSKKGFTIDNPADKIIDASTADFSTAEASSSIDEGEGFDATPQTHAPEADKASSAATESKAPQAIKRIQLTMKPHEHEEILKQSLAMGYRSFNQFAKDAFRFYIENAKR